MFAQDLIILPVHNMFMMKTVGWMIRVLNREKLDTSSLKNIKSAFTSCRTKYSKVIQFHNFGICSCRERTVENLDCFAVLPYLCPLIAWWSPYNRSLVVAAENHSVGSVLSSGQGLTWKG